MILQVLSVLVIAATVLGQDTKPLGGAGGLGHGGVRPGGVRPGGVRPGGVKPGVVRTGGFGHGGGFGQGGFGPGGGFGQGGFGQGGFGQGGFGQGGFGPGGGFGTGGGIGPGGGFVAAALEDGSSSGCRYWCRSPEGQAFCCETDIQPLSPPIAKPDSLGECPPVRPTCPATKFGPPLTCSSDGSCPGVEKCCYDRCLETTVCKTPVYI